MMPPPKLALAGPQESRMDYEAARRNMVESQIRTNKVTHAGLLAALSSLPRERFLPPERAYAAYVDDDIPLAPGRFLMEPMVFARLVQLAEPKLKDRALVVGSGTGYGAAVLARLVASVVALESDPGLAARAKDQLVQLAIGNVSQAAGPLAQGWPGSAPYDVMLIEGAVEEVPQTLFDQLADGGRLVAVVMTEGVGRATLFVEREKAISHRPYFDAAVPPLAEFRRQRGFVF
jgi:protein-L-isoaspartate(D-aspartate) O-methyltransferase